ncbi:MAG: ATP-binding cassette domain-containing protein [Clostridia bacterium]|nr:ATP-binding cassette domain-containing protein [Clostridia bacterium]
MVNYKIKNLSFFYPDSNTPALNDINLEIEQGEFIVVCGKSGSGKSTLLRMLKPELTPKGKSKGEIIFFEKNKNDFSQRDSARNIGFLLQNTEYQAVTHSVRSELAFGLENLGLDSKTIRLRIAEISAYFSLEDLLDKKISELSGGQKQFVCLASIVAMNPKAIILDEPTSQLDPVSASAFLDTVRKLRSENGITIIISEHRLENVIPLADRIIIMEDGKIISDCKPENISKDVFYKNEFVKKSMPLPMRVHSHLGLDGRMPLSIAQGHKMLEHLMADKLKYTIPSKEVRELSEDNAIQMKNVRYAYENSGYVLKGINLTVKKGSFTALMGANGAGKTTALSLMSGILECKSGKIKIFEKSIKKYKPAELYNGMLAVLPQKCESLFAGNTVREDLESVLKNSDLSKEEREKRIESISEFTEIKSFLDRHPYDISGGEMQRAALAMVLLKQPKIIFLDEPTKGMDNLFKIKFAEKIKELCEGGVTVVMVSHDTEFCAEYCDECAMIFDGLCVLKENKYDFFAQNFFYTTAANKISRDIFPTAVTQGQVLELCKKNLQN